MTFHCLPPRKVSRADIALCKRLLTAYALSSGQPATQGYWGWIANHWQSELVECLSRGRATELARLLSTMFGKGFLSGIAPPTAAEANDPAAMSKGLRDLGEAVGVIRARGAQEMEPALVVEQIEDRIGLPLGAPDVGTPCGLLHNDTVIPVDWADHAYTALRMRDVSKSSRVVEIGAGYGGTADWFLRLRPDLERYTIVDLPIVNVIQGYFLAQSLGHSVVSFIGETATQIVIQPDWALPSALPCDVVANKNSFPEMPRNTVVDYLTWTRNNARFLYSCNQESSAPMPPNGESQQVVGEVVEEVGGFTRLRRDHSWMRYGYVEEIYEIDA